MGGSGTRQAGAISIADVVAPHSEVAISRLKQLNLQVMLLSGDHRLTAEAVGHSLGISKAMAEVMPDEKQQVVRRLPDQGEVVAMVEDKINDAPALAAADLGVASGAAADVAMEAADVVLVYSNLVRRPGECPRHDPDTIALSHT
ncbi:MAG: HAD-IC family P-type ATPase, partial [Planctomycetales bacterium]|nr:HAD-IC family P-type ATPase [Planctomycetales bacterium]